MRNACWGLAAMLLGSVAMAEEQAIKADVRVGELPGTRETVTVVQPDGKGGQTTITRETVKEAGAAKAKPAVEADTTPRRARVAVVPAVFSQDLRSKYRRELQESFGLGDSAVVENPGYTSYIVDALVNSRKLDVLERENLASAIKELDFAESDYADTAKAIRMGHMLNADYIVVPEIRYLGLTLENKNVPFVNQTSAQVKGKLATNVRVIDVATSRIVASHIGSVEKKVRLKDPAGSAGRPVFDFIGDLYAESAREEAANVIDTAYPIKVVAVAGKILTVNRGEGAIAEGEMLEIIQTGDVIIDPDTKENLGYQETKLGKARVIDVGEKTAQAERVEGTADVPRLSICRRVKPAAEAPAPIATAAPKLD